MTIDQGCVAFCSSFCRSFRAYFHKSLHSVSQTDLRNVYFGKNLIFWCTPATHNFIKVCMCITPTSVEIPYFKGVQSSVWFRCSSHAPRVTTIKLKYGSTMLFIRGVSVCVLNATQRLCSIVVLPPLPPPPPKTTNPLRGITALEINCPILHTQQNFPLICQARKALRRSLGHGLHVRRVAFLLLCFFSCVFTCLASHFMTLPEKGCLGSLAGGRDPQTRTAGSAAPHSTATLNVAPVTRHMLLEHQLPPFPP